MTTQANEVLFKRSQAAVWIQPSGPGTKYIYLNCASMEGYQRNEGDITLRYCKDPGRAGKFKVSDSYQGERGPVTSTISLPLGKTTNYALSLKCPFNLQVRYTTCERQDDPTGWEKILHFSTAQITQRSSQPLVARMPSEEGDSLTSAAISAQDLLEVSRVLVVRQSTSETKSLNDITFLTEEQCKSNCGPAQAGCVYGYAVANAASYVATANVLHTENGGTWAATAADPFAVGEDLSSVVLNGDRVIVARGVTDAANPAEIAYSDNEGVAWTQVNVGAVNGQYINRLIWLSKPYLWAVTNDGYVYFSEDAGLSWTAQDSASATTQNLHDIDFADNQNGVAVGALNAVIVTTNGGLSWSALTGPAAGINLNAVDMVDAESFWVGTANGKLYKTTDAGVTWTQVRFTSDNVGSIGDVEFFDDSFGYLVHNSASPVARVLRTVDGGASWDVLTTPTNSGANRLNVCDQNTAYVAGNTNTGTSLILKVS